MPWYVLRTIAGKEDKALLLLQRVFHDINIVFPKRRLSWRKKGRVIDVIKPLFSGYMFVLASDRQIFRLNLWLRTQKLDIWFLRVGNVLTSISKQEMDLINKMLGPGDIVGESEIIKTGQRVTVVRGPLVGLEGIIRDCSKRNRRITIMVTVAGEERQVELEGTWVDYTDKQSCK